MFKSNGSKILLGVAILFAVFTAGLTLSKTNKKDNGIEITVYKSPRCECCAKWEEHMRKNGFNVKSIFSNDMDNIKAEHGVTEELGSCHTGIVDGYIVEGHVPADLVHRLLKERPKVAGIAAPGMPNGSPGMEGDKKDAYDLVLFSEGKKVSVYDRR